MRYKRNSCPGKSFNLPRLTGTPIGKKDIRAERNPVKNGCTPMCEDSCSDPLRDSQRPSQENSRASPPPPTTGASNWAGISPPLKHWKVNTHRNLPDSEEMGVFMPSGKGETHMTAQRNYSPFTAPSRPDHSRGHGAGSFRSSGASPRVTGRPAEAPRSLTPLTGAANAGGGPPLR